MQKLTMTLFTLALVVSMAACAPKKDAPAASAQTSAAGETAGQRNLPLTTTLILGTLKLEGTANEVTAEQAAELVPLWKGYLAVSKSESASRLELDGVAQQIAETMTDAQMDAIEAMDLTMASIGALMQELGIEVAGGLTAEQRETIQAQRQAGQVTGAGPGGGFGMGRGGGVPSAGGPPGGHVEGLSPDQLQTRIAERQANGGGPGGGTMGGTALVEKLIEVLSAKL